MSINLNSRNNTLCCKVNDLYTALMASELLNDCVDDVVVMLKTCVDYVNIVSSQEVQIQHARFTMDGEEFRQYVMELDRHRPCVARRTDGTGELCQSSVREAEHTCSC